MAKDSTTLWLMDNWHFVVYRVWHKQKVQGAAGNLPFSQFTHLSCCLVRLCLEFPLWRLWPQVSPGEIETRVSPQTSQTGKICFQMFLSYSSDKSALNPWSRTHQTFLNYISFLGARHIGFVSQNTEVIRNACPVKWLCSWGTGSWWILQRKADWPQPTVRCPAGHWISHRLAEDEANETSAPLWVGKIRSLVSNDCSENCDQTLSHAALVEGLVWKLDQPFESVSMEKTGRRLPFWAYTTSWEEMRA